MGQRIRSGVLTAACLGAFAMHVSPSHAGGIPVVLAQAPTAAPKPAPANVAVAGRNFIVEGIVVVLLGAGAVFAVCRTSGRT